MTWFSVEENVVSVTLCVCVCVCSRPQPQHMLRDYHSATGRETGREHEECVGEQMFDVTVTEWDCSSAGMFICVNMCVVLSVSVCICVCTVVCQITGANTENTLSFLFQWPV